jgi:hypothetical protein
MTIITCQGPAALRRLGPDSANVGRQSPPTATPFVWQLPLSGEPALSPSARKYLASTSASADAPDGNCARSRMQHPRRRRCRRFLMSHPASYGRSARPGRPSKPPQGYRQREARREGRHYVLRGRVRCALCDRRMVGTHQKGSNWYRCRFRATRGRRGRRTPERPPDQGGRDPRRTDRPHGPKDLRPGSPAPPPR